MKQAWFWDKGEAVAESGEGLMRNIISIVLDVVGKVLRSLCLVREIPKIIRISRRELDDVVEICKSILWLIDRI